MQDDPIVDRVHSTEDRVNLLWKDRETNIRESVAVETFLESLVQAANTALREWRQEGESG